MGNLAKELTIFISDNRTPLQVYVSGHIRISVLTSNLIRIEDDKSETFEDMPTQRVWHRVLDNTHFDIKDRNGCFDVITDCVIFRINRKSAKLVSVKFKDGRTVRNFKWGNLKGTRRTLDGTFGKVGLEDGVISRSGVAIFDDSSSLIINAGGEFARRKNSEKDIYVFAYGHNYRKAIRDLYRLTGEVPLIPKYALGNWWSRYRAYSQQEYIALMEKFIEKKIPLTVATVDMDWHLVHDIPRKYESHDGSSLGWTGYTWNEKLFPDYKGFLAWLHAHGMKVTLNLHPASGVKAYEKMYMEMALELGVDYRNEQTVEFDLTNPDFVNAYFRILHHPYERDGVSFWWIDWQQGRKSKLEGLDPLFALNHYHYLDKARGADRGLILSRYGGIGSHRYPLGFSGDTAMNWATLNFQPYFTVTAANVGYTWWSHDIGGHHFGIKDDELYVRWVQFGVFSPIMRLHSTMNDLMGKEPWNYSACTERIVTEFMRLRHRMIPYIYTMNYRNHHEGIALCEPMYYQYPEDARAYKVRNEYMFGSELIVVPVTKKISPKTKVADTEVFLPRGRWTDIFTGQVYKGDCLVRMNRGIETIPVLAKEGAIIPLAEYDDYSNSVASPDVMRVLIFRGTNDFTMYDDDGETKDFERGSFVQRRFTIEESHDRLSFAVMPVTGDVSLSKKRKFIFSFKDIVGYVRAEVSMNDTVIATAVNHNGECLEYIAELLPTDKLTIKFIGAKSKDNGKCKDHVINIFSKYQGSNVRKSLRYKPFMHVDSDRECLDMIQYESAKFMNKSLRSQLAELRSMIFDDSRNKKVKQ